MKPIILFVSSLWRPISSKAICLHRSCFGMVMFFSILRFWWMGWIDSIYIQPKFHFSYLGFEHFKPWHDTNFVYLHFFGLGMSSLMIALGIYPRVFSGLFFTLFVIVELWEKSTYLNHYYLITLLSFLYTLIRSDGFFSIMPNQSHQSLPKIYLYLLQFQILCVYFFAGLAKINMEWLIEGKPLMIWLKPYFEWHVSQIPFFNRILSFLNLQLKHLAIFMSWSGAIFDLLMPTIMLSRYQKIGFIIACVFHIIVGLLFPIGMFSFIMVSSLLLFMKYDDDLKDHLWQIENWKIKVKYWVYSLFIFFWILFQMILPLRYLWLVEDHVNWYEDHYRFAWRVMLVEKVGFIEFNIVCNEKKQKVHPRYLLSKQQYQQMSIQADLILEYAHFLKQQYQNKCLQNIKIFADAWVSYQGKKMTLLINPTLDLTLISRSQNNRDFMMPP